MLDHFVSDPIGSWEFLGVKRLNYGRHLVEVRFFYRKTSWWLRTYNIDGFVDDFDMFAIRRLTAQTALTL